MTTPSPLEQQRQWLKDFLVAENASVERKATAQQQYVAVQRAIEEQYSTASKEQDSRLKSQGVELERVIRKIEEHRYRVVANIRELLDKSIALPDSLHSVVPHTSNRSSAVTPLLALSDAATQLENIADAATQLYLQGLRQKDRRSLIRFVVLAVIVFALILLVGTIYLR